jgi:hypothetical protein
MTLKQLSSKGRKLMSTTVICVAAVALLGQAGGAAGRQVPFCRQWVKRVSNKVLGEVFNRQADLSARGRSEI